MISRILFLQSCLFLVVSMSSQTLDLLITTGTNSPYGDVDYALSTTYDENGNMYVAGKGSESIVFGQGETNETILTNGIAFVAKYTKDGSLVWVNELGNPYDGLTPTEIKLSNTDDVYITGHFYNEAKIYGTDTSMVGNKFTAFLIKYNNSGEYQWSQTVDGPEHDFGSNLFIDKNNDVYMAGAFEDTIVFAKGTDKEKRISSRGEDDLFIVKYSSSGNYLWCTEMGSKNIDVAVDFVQLDSNSFYFVSNCTDLVEIGDHAKPDTIFPIGYRFGLFSKFDLSGNFIAAFRQGIDLQSACALNISELKFQSAISS